MTRLFIVMIGLVSLIFLSACTPTIEANVEETEQIAATEMNAPAFIEDLLTALAEELKIDITDIKLVSVEKVQWRDSCLGVERKGLMCLEVITPGYLIVFETPQGSYEAHTNEDGTAFIFVPPQEAGPTAEPASNDTQ